MRKSLIFLIVALAACVAAPALAQSPRQNRPYRGLFGAGVGTMEQMLSVTFNASAGYDDDVLLASGGTSRPIPGNTTASTIGSFGGGLNYSLSRERMAFSAGYSASVSFYPMLNDPVQQDYYSSQYASAGGTFELSNRTRLGMSVNASFQPLYYLSAFPVLADPLTPAPEMTDPQIPESALAPGVLPPTISTDPVLGVRSVNYINTGAGINLSHAFTRKMSGSVSYSASRSEAGPATYGPYYGQSVGGGLAYSLGKGLSAHAGYTYAQNEYGAGATKLLYEGQQIDAGVGFSKALSLTRRTSISFSTGTSVINDKTSTHYGVTGMFGITREIGRTWAATAGFHRDVSFTQSFFAPVFSDSISAGLGGMINRRLQFQSGVGTALGKVGFGTGDNGFSNFYGSAGIRYGLSRSLGLTVDWAYYWYDYGTDVTLPQGAPSKIGRQSIHAGLSYFVPIFTKARSPHASR